MTNVPHQRLLFGTSCGLPSAAAWNGQNIWLWRGLIWKTSVPNSLPTKSWTRTRETPELPSQAAVTIDMFSVPAQASQTFQIQLPSVTAMTYVSTVSVHSPMDLMLFQSQELATPSASSSRVRAFFVFFCSYLKPNCRLLDISRTRSVRWQEENLPISPYP